MKLLYIPGIAIFSYMVYCIFPTYYFKWLKKPYLQPKNDTKQILLTFDDGPDPRYTDALLEVLAENNVHAVFLWLPEKQLKTPK